MVQARFSAEYGGYEYECVAKFDHGAFVNRPVETAPLISAVSRKDPDLLTSNARRQLGRYFEVVRPLSKS